MRLVRDIPLALGIGVVWSIVVVQAIGYLAAASPGAPPEMAALARGDAVTFVLIALLRDVAIYAIPSLFVGYLITRLMARPVLFALVAGSLPFLFGVYSVGMSMLEGSIGGARGVYMALNTVLVLVAIPAAVALIQWSTRFFPGADAQTN